MDRHTKRRQEMVRTQLERRGIRDARLLDAARAVPRHLFVPAPLRRFAYDDRPLPIGCGQTISQPYIVALMIEALRLGGDETVLEVGAGSGYCAALLHRLAARVIAIERHQKLAEQARANLQAAGCETVQVICADGSLGWPDAAPYDAILVSAGAPEPPAALCQQLATGGRLVIPTGTMPDWQSLERITLAADGSLHRQHLCDVRFVPLVGEQGWPTTTR